MRKLFLFLCLLVRIISYSNEYKIDAVYPTHWWVGMKNQKLQLIVHGANVAENNFSVTYPGVKLVKVNKVENRNYVFIDLIISSSASAGKIKIHIKNPVGEGNYLYELRPRRKGNGTLYAQGVTSKDFIYLLMPDRFANGDAFNDSFNDMRDIVANRNNPFDRHGGDLQGVIDHLDYLKSLGVTSVWMTPVVENDMSRTIESGTSRSTYHGYAFTDQYKVDKRFGNNETYKKLSEQLHKRDMKLIQDAVYNHLGNDHWSVKDLPMKNWLNQWPSYQNTSYKDQPLVDPYASDIDKAITLRGWFTPFLADLNQRNPFVENFLIQYAMWATEEFGVDSWRVDTYFYNEPEFLNHINDALLKEFPSLTIFGEATAQTVLNSAYFVQNNYTDISFKHNAQGVTDFPLQAALLDGLKQPEVNKVYNTLAQDIVYKDPTRNCIFLDNHDQDRFYSVIGEDFDKFKIGINWLLTLRGIPQLYYGTEILMKNFKDPTDAEVRRDFPGGWKQDTANKFMKEGRTTKEEEAWQYISKLANFRKSSSPLTKGKLMQYLPEDGLYTYFRYDPLQTVMVITYIGKEEATVKMNRFDQRTRGFTKLRNVLTGEVINLNDFTIKPKQSFVFELMK